MSVVALLEAEALDPQLELAELTEAARGDGAMVSFVGLARPEIDAMAMRSTRWCSIIIRP